ncbi:probable oxidoreductase [Vibrio ishigakensis]|uniref:Probable oxidoreductase n=1 Tax=Vibrio ishigakensis TaxID=1481914 RepID=A0A0B8P0U0_9VIBR|nr:probable oxidoreductase [Vibrio ishigakensis]
MSVGHHRTYSSYIPLAKKILDSDSFGKLVAVQGSALFYKPKAYFEAGSWRTKKGGGPILINLIHEIGIFRYLCGEVVKVYAHASNSVRQYEVEDTVVISFEFDTGCLGSFILSDCASSYKSWEMTSGENSMYPYFPKQSCYHFSGTNGCLDFPSMQFRFYKGTPSWTSDFGDSTPELKVEDPLKAQLEYFIECVESKKEAKVTCRSAYKNMLVIDAIQRSINEDKPVYL